MSEANPRHRADCKQRIPIPPTEDEEEAEFGRPSRARIPSPADACSIRFRERFLLTESEEFVEIIAAAMVDDMDVEKVKEVCLYALRKIGFVVSLRPTSNPKRDRTAETARRSEKRAQARAEKAAQKMAQIQADSTS